MNGPDIIEDPEAYVTVMVDGFLLASMWADLDTGDEETGCTESEAYDSVPRLAIESHAKVVAYCAAFALANRDDLAEVSRTEWASAYAAAEQMGHDLWLTGGGHGTGFWDHGYGDVGDRLTTACEYQTESAGPYVGDDGAIYLDCPTYEPV